jgi:hypothetical protein
MGSCGENGRGIDVPQTCTICRRQDERAINLALLAGEPFRSIAGRTGVSKSALVRHRINCVPRDLAQARLSKKVAQSDLLLADVCRLQRRANSILSKAEMSGDLRTALAAIRELRGTIELLARVTGELQETTQVNVLVSPEYLQLRTTILRTLAPYPEARMAIASALRNVDHAGA